MVGLTSKFEKGLLRLFVLLCAAVPSCILRVPQHEFP